MSCWLVLISQYNPVHIVSIPTWWGHFLYILFFLKIFILLRSLVAIGLVPSPPSRCYWGSQQWSYLECFGTIFCRQHFLEGRHTKVAIHSLFLSLPLSPLRQPTNFHNLLSYVTCVFKFCLKQLFWEFIGSLATLGCWKADPITVGT
jgi:hypothetical protein